MGAVRRLLWIRLYLWTHQSSNIRPTTFYLMTGITAYSIFAAIYFLGVFVVHPSEHFVMHTLPFSLLVLSVSLVGTRNVIFGHATGRFRKHKWTPLVRCCLSPCR